MKPLLFFVYFDMAKISCQPHCIKRATCSAHTARPRSHSPLSHLHHPRHHHHPLSPHRISHRRLCLAARRPLSPSRDTRTIRSLLVARQSLASPTSTVLQTLPPLTSHLSPLSLPYIYRLIAPTSPPPPSFHSQTNPPTPPLHKNKAAALPRLCFCNL